jgi:threonine dehydrogenase-like Zn-dependent dehydrogenase
VVVQGAGPVGISALAVAKTAGASRVIVIGGPRHRLELARRFGADEVIDLAEVPRPADRLDRVRQLTRGYGADVVLECAGVPQAVVEGWELCRDGGKYLVLGHYCDAGPVSLNPHLITRKQLQLFGSWSSEPRHMKAAISFLERHPEVFPFASMVTHRFALDQANEALQLVGRWEAGKCVFTPGARPVI